MKEENKNACPSACILGRYFVISIETFVDPLQSKAIKIVDPRQSKAKRKFCENNLTNYRVIHGRNLPSLNVKKISQIKKISIFVPFGNNLQNYDVVNLPVIPVKIPVGREDRRRRINVYIMLADFQEIVCQKFFGSCMINLVDQV